MYANKCLYWEHGTLLQPQHFQVATQQIPSEVANLLYPYAFGIKRIGIREEALLLQSFELHELDLFFPTGEHLVLGDNAFVLNRKFSEAWTNTEEPLPVWLGLMSFNPQGQNVTETDQPEFNINTRFIASYEAAQIPDQYGAGPQADVRFMQYNLKLLFGDEPNLYNIPVIPIALLERDGEHISLAKNYAPPCVDIFSSSLLREALLGIRNSVVARVGQLEDYKLLPGSKDISALTAQTLALHSLHGVLARYAPLLEHYCELSALHPWPIYGVLRQLVGELSIFSSDISPLGETAHGERALPIYDHNNLGTCFAASRLIISRITDSLVMGPAYSFCMDAKQNYYDYHLPPHVCGNSYRYWLLMRSSSNLGLLKEQSRRAKLAPIELLPSLVSKSLPGVQLTVVDQPPTGLPKRDDTIYFAIDQSDKLWTSIMLTGDLALFLPGVPDDTVIYITLIQG